MKASSFAFALFGFAATAMFVKAEDAAPVDSDVLVLTQKNFATTVPEEKLILVEFYAPWCGHCKALAPEYEIAATELKESNIPIAKVDCTVETELCQEHGIQGYPTLKVFKNGTPSDYTGARKADGIVSYLKKQALPALSILTADQVAAFAAGEKVVVVGILGEEATAEREALEKTANSLRDRYTFAVVDETAAEANGVKAPAVVLFKKFDNGKDVLEGTFTEESLDAFIKLNAVPTMDDIGPDNYANYMEAGLPLGYLFYSTPEERTKYGPEIEALAKEYKGKVNFVYIDAAKFGSHAENLNLKQTWPAFGIQNVESGAKFPLDQSTEITATAVKTMIDGVLDGSLNPSVKTEPVPETNDGPVTIVVGSTYESIVHDQTKDVLIEFYAPWCGHCKSLAPIYDVLGEKYKGTDVVIAKIDATANDLPAGLPFQVAGFPTIKFRKAGSSEYMDYDGGRNVEAFHEFIQANAVTKPNVVLGQAGAGTPAEADIEHDEL